MKRCVRLACILGAAYLLCVELLRVFVRTKLSKSGGTSPSILVGLNTVKSNADLVHAIRQTWGREVDLLITSCSKFTRGVRKISTPCDEYPPIETWRALLEEMHTRDFDWYLKVDDDTYVDAANLRLLVNHLEHTDDYNHLKFVYIGATGYGREFERESLGLQGKPFVLGGSGVLMSRKALQAVRNILATCMRRRVKARHSDTLLAGCIYSLFSDYDVSHKDLFSKFSAHFTPYYPAVKLTRTMPYAESTVPTIMQQPNTFVTMHSVKSACLLTLLHGQVKHAMRTPPSFKSPYTYNPLYRLRKTRSMMKNLNFTLQRQENLCPLSASYQVSWEVDATHVLSFTASRAHGILRYLSTIGSLGNHVKHFRAQKGTQYGRLSPGEVGVKRSFRSMFQDAINKQLGTIAIFEDDVLFVEDYGNRLESLLSDPECSCFLNSATGCPPGVLLLGATSWGSRNIEWMDYEKSMNVDKRCVEYQPSMFGAFAGIYNVDLLKLLIELFDETDEPLDWYWSKLADIGFVIRVAFPFLNIADVSHESSVRDRTGVHDARILSKIAEDRRAQHAWNRETYIDVR